MPADKRRAAKAVSEQCVRDDTAAALQRVWDEQVLPNWDMAIREPRTRELWWQGVPSKSRPAAWKLAIRNELGLTSQTFEKARARAEVSRHGGSSPVPEGDQLREVQSWASAIHRDVAGTLPELGLFQTAQPLHKPLVDLLTAYACYRSDIGYTTALHLPAALLLLTLPSATDAFIALANLLNRPLPLAFATRDAAGMARAYQLVLRMLEMKRPRLHCRLFGPAERGGLALEPALVLEPLLQTLFLHRCCERPKAHTSPVAATSGAPASRGLSLERVQRIWDVFIFDGDAGIVRACVGVLAAVESALYGSHDEVLQVLGWQGRGFGPVAASEDDERRQDGFMRLVREAGKADQSKRTSEPKSASGRT